jgi:Chaperone of endosialidase
MKNISLFLLFFILISSSVQGQTTLSYSGTGITNINSSPTKSGVIAQNFTTVAPGANLHAGLIGNTSNGAINVGVLGTTVNNTVGTATKYIGVFGDNSFNSLNVGSAETYGGYFTSKNLGAGSLIYGVKSEAGGSNNTSSTIAVEGIATNNSNTTTNTTIGVRGISTSGSSTIGNLNSVTNPGGYFSSNDGQGIYATTTGGYNLLTLGKVSQAITGYSNQANAYLNAGIVGYADGTGAFKAGVMGYVDGTAGTTISYAIYGKDNINTSTTYAGYFSGKVSIASSLSVSSTGSFGGAISGTTAGFSGCVTASNLSCPSDLRYKKNIVPMQNSLSNILKINGVRYDWKQEEFPEKQFSDKNQIGFIAQEIEKVFPEMVFTDEKGFKSVDYARLTPVLVEAIKELNSRNEKLEIKNQKLESRLDKIEALLSSSNLLTGK